MKARRLRRENELYHCQVKSNFLKVTRPVPGHLIRFRLISLSRVSSLDHLESRKEYISMGWMDTVKDFSIFMPSYISESDICLTFVLNNSGNISSRLILPLLVAQVMPRGL